MTVAFPVDVLELALLGLIARGLFLGILRLTKSAHGLLLLINACAYSVIFLLECQLEFE